MKLLFDQNLSRKLVPQIASTFPGSSHVILLGLDAADDATIWQYARERGYSLVTKDTDMVDLCVLRGAPPKVLWLRIGNCTTELAETVLRNNVERIWRFAESPSATVLSLFRLTPVGD